MPDARPEGEGGVFADPVNLPRIDAHPDPVLEGRTGRQSVACHRRDGVL